jgi:hypothetical protein
MIIIAGVFCAVLGAMLWACFHARISKLEKGCMDISAGADQNKQAICKCETVVKRVSDQVQRVQAEIICKKVADHVRVSNHATGGSVNYKGGKDEQD